MTSPTPTPIKNAFHPAKTLTKLDPDFEGDGYQSSGEELSISDEQIGLVRERRLVFEERLTFTDAQVGRSVTKTTSERLSHRETVTAFLNKTLVGPTERPVQTPVSTLTTGLGQGGFGQLGVGGSKTINA